MSAFPEDSHSVLQLLLFVDERSRSTQQYQEIVNYLDEHRSHSSFEIKIIDVSEQPDLAEYFKLVATPTLIKIHPPPKQIFAGSNSIGELDNWWPQWIGTLIPERSEHSPNTAPLCESSNESTLNITHLSKIIRLSDEVFELQQRQAELTEQLPLL